MGGNGRYGTYKGPEMSARVVCSRDSKEDVWLKLRGEGASGRG